MGVILVTGAGSGIGQAIAEALAEDEHKVVVTGRTIDRLLRVAYTLQQKGTESVAVAMDVTKPESVAAAVQRVHDVFGPVQGIVNNAGTGTVGTVLDTPIDELRRVLEVNVIGSYLVTQAFLPDVIASGGGPVINISSSLALVGVPERAAYATSKAALLAFTRSLHADFHSVGVRANAVLPGTVDTPWIDRLVAGTYDPEGIRQDLVKRQPIGRMGTPQEIAEIVRLLAGPRGTFILGSCFVADGGMTAL
jgi:NAD(P)-dependent dehydrogenase (short-subunit alcohol dehydrogenase family)